LVLICITYIRLILCPEKVHKPSSSYERSRGERADVANARLAELVGLLAHPLVRLDAVAHRGAVFGAGHRGGRQRPQLLGAPEAVQGDEVFHVARVAAKRLLSVIRTHLNLKFTALINNLNFQTVGKYKRNSKFTGYTPFPGHFLKVETFFYFTIPNLGISGAIFLSLIEITKLVYFF
jgi:hypothetical protein